MPGDGTIDALVMSSLAQPGNNDKIYLEVSTILLAL